MNSRTVLAAAVAMSLTLANFAFADNNDRQNDRGRNDRAQRSNQGEMRGNPGQRNRGDNRSRANEDARRGPGAGPNHNFHRGERLSSEYRHRNYVVDYWRGHHLSAPPRGYHWVQTGSDYVLVAIATGVIANLLLNN